LRARERGRKTGRQGARACSRERARGREHKRARESQALQESARLACEAETERKRDRADEPERVRAKENLTERTRAGPRGHCPRSLRQILFCAHSFKLLPGSDVLDSTSTGEKRRETSQIKTGRTSCRGALQLEKGKNPIMHKTRIILRAASLATECGARILVPLHFQCVVQLFFGA